MQLPATESDMDRDMVRQKLEEEAAEAIFRDKRAEGMRATKFQPDEHQKQAINDQAMLYKNRLKQYHSDREVRGRTFEEKKAVTHNKEVEKERSYKAMLSEIRSAPGRTDGYGYREF